MAQLSDLKILIVEDTLDNQTLLQFMLRRYGFEMVFASNGQDGANKALEGDFDVVFMDIQMPFMDGFEAVRILRDQGYSKPIIALTAHAMDSDRTKILSSGFNGYLSKPVRREELVESIEKFGLQV